MVKNSYNNWLRICDSALGLLIVYRLSLDISYYFAVSKVYSYMGLSATWNPIWYLQSWFVMLAVFAVLPKSEKASSFLLQVLYLIIIVPDCSVYGLSNQAKNPSSLLFLIMLSLGFALTCYIASKKFSRKTLKHKTSSDAVFIILGSFVLFIALSMCIQYGIHPDAFDLGNVYKIREEIHSSGVLGYLMVWAYRVFCPLLIAESMIERKRGQAIFWCGIQILMYLTIAQKEILLSAIMVVVVLLLMRYKTVWVTFCSILICCCVIPTALFMFNGSISLLSLFPTRLVCIPAQITFEYFDYFNSHPQLLYSETSFGFLFGETYPFGNLTPGQVISQIYEGGLSNSNTGFIGSAFSNGGYLSLLIESCILGVIISLVNSFSAEEDSVRFFALALSPFIALSNGSLSSVFLTGGIGVLLIVLLFVTPHHREKGARKEPGQ